MYHVLKRSMRSATIISDEYCAYIKFLELRGYEGLFPESDENCMSSDGASVITGYLGQGTLRV